jgi:ribonucleotide reductase alpha subunit
MSGYTYDQVLEESKKYFNGNELAAKVFADKYSLRDNEGNLLELTPDSMHDRLAKEFARIDHEKYNLSFDARYKIYRDAINKFYRICLQGSPMAAIGNNYQFMSASNCVVIESPSDSMDGIIDCAKNLAQLYKRRCGVGIDISTLRPEGAKVNNAARTTSGAWSFADLYSYITRMVGQSGRRGALMITLDVHHPDVVKFATMKHDMTKVTGANISIRLSNEFLTAVEQNKKYEQRWPMEGVPAFSRMVNARDVWNIIVESATKTAEPGLIMWDNMIDNLPAHCYPEFKTISTNPCQPEWATVLTPNGISTIGKIRIGDVIWSGKQWTKIINKMYTGEKDVYAFKTRAGTFYGTENHRVVSAGEKIEAKDADSIDISCCSTHQYDDTVATLSFEEQNKFNQNVVDGLVIGDGMIHKASNNKVLLCIGCDDQDYFMDKIASLLIEERPGINISAWDIKTTIKYNELPKTYERRIPDRFKFGDFDTRRAFLRGIYSANGSIVGNRITLKSASSFIIEDVQQMLSSLGIASYYTINKAHEVEFENGTYECKESYDLNIGTADGRHKFIALIGFIQKYKCNNALNTLNVNPRSRPPKTTYEIVEKQFINKEAVYDITVEADEHTYWTGGLLVSNCSEIALSAFDSCRLISINLTAYVRNPFTKNANFDFSAFSDDIIISQQMADNLVDLELELIERIKSVCEPGAEQDLWNKLSLAGYNGRRTGLGTHGLADTLAQLCIRYDSDLAIDTVNKIYKTLRDISYDASINLAKIRGPFPVYDKKKEKSCNFIKRLPKSLREKMQKYGRRNISLLTQAPTGSVSILSKVGSFNTYNVSSGVEPVFRNSYIRRKKINHDDKVSRVDFVDVVGDKWQEFKVFHSNVQNYLDVKGLTNVDKLPNFFVTSDEIDWKKRIEIQGTEQQYIDHSISSTINLPKNTTSEIVGNLYLDAWKSGLKGVTVYVEGSRDGVLINADKTLTERPADIERHAAPKRSTELSCNIKKVKINGEAWTIFVGLLNNKPYEIFGGLSKYVDIPNKYKNGRIVKNGKVNGITAYNLVVGDGDDQMIIKDIANAFENQNYGALTRTISLALRHGTPIEFIVEQLQKDKYSDMTSFSKVIARVLKSYISDGTNVTAEKTCPTCKMENSLIYQEGCVLCKNCSYTKCS